MPASRPTGLRRSTRRLPSPLPSPPISLQWEPRPQRAVDFCRRWAVPSGVLMFVLLVVQANTGVLSGYRRDATVRSVGVGWRDGCRGSRGGEGAGRRNVPILALDYCDHKLARFLSAERNLCHAVQGAHPMGQHART